MERVTVNGVDAVIFHHFVFHFQVFLVVGAMQVSRYGIYQVVERQVLALSVRARVVGQGALSGHPVLEVVASQVLLDLYFHLVSDVLRFSVLVRQVMFQVVYFFQVNVVRQSTSLHLFQRRLARFSENHRIVLFRILRPTFVRELIGDAGTNHFSASTRVRHSRIKGHGVRVHVDDPPAFFVRINRTRFIRPGFPTLRLVARIARASRSYLRFKGAQVTFSASHVTVIIQVPAEVSDLRERSVHAKPFFPIALRF